jgi:MFS transporter, DHA1 family, multidrug resistance protein
VNTQTKPALSMGEFVPLMALMISLIALSIDAMLPALPGIGRDLGVSSDNDQQLVVTALLLGLGIAQMVFGPLSDSLGRKRAIYSGYVIFVIGCVLSIVASSFEVMLIGRVLQGLGAAGPRIICIALVRDQYEGREMARIMSIIMGVFILVPALAPMVGQGIVVLSHWRGIFVLFLVLSIVAWAWFAVRQPETLPIANRVPFTVAVIWSGVKETCGNRVAIGYTVTAGLIFGAFVGYLSTAQQMFEVVYGITDLFPFYFAVLAVSIGLASFLNARLVMRFGMRLLSAYALRILTTLSLGYFLYALSLNMAPALALNMAYFVMAFMCIGILFGNFNALAMEPLGHIAGIGAAVVGSLSTLMSVALGGMIGRAFDGTVLPLVGGFAILGLLAVGAMHVTESGKTTDTPTNGNA